jgi:anaerobic magnesium-protoporphyrin IX monomethyl ester cyclase
MKFLFIVKDMEYESIGIMSLSAVLKRKGHETMALCAKYENDLIGEVKKISPDIIGYSTTTGAHKFYLGINSQLKKDIEFLSIFGGPHPTFFPEMIEQDGVDMICLGEGEEAIIELADALSSKKKLDGIKNLYIKNEGKIIRNNLRPFISDLDSLPYPDRNIFRRYIDKLPSPYRVFITGRGCPYSCSYCFNHVNRKLFEGKYIRHRKVDKVIEEVLEVKKDGTLRVCGFLDDTFTLNKSWLEEFCKVYKIKVGLPFFCHLRADLVDRNIAKLLSGANCIAGVIGIETGCYRLRKEILKKNITDEDIINAANYMKENGIRVITQNMIGIPGDTPHNVLQMAKLNSEIKSNHMNLYFYQPYPKTDLCELSIEKGLYSGDVDNIGPSYSAYDSQIILKLANKKELIIVASLFHLAVRIPVFRKFIALLIKIPVVKNILKLFKPLDNFFRNQDYLKVKAFTG